MTESIKNRPGILTFIVILAATTIIDSVLARYAYVTWPSAPGVSALYFAVAFMIPFALWFGAWGTIAAYLGCLIGAGIGTVPFGVNLYWSLADLWQVLIPLLAFKRFHADINLKTKRDWLVYLVFGCLLNNLAGAVWGSVMMGVGGVSAWSEVPRTLGLWLAGNIIVTIVITTLLLRFATPYIEKWNLRVQGYWS
jgi:hypothetical protein